MRNASGLYWLLLKLKIKVPLAMRQPSWLEQIQRRYNILLINKALKHYEQKIQSRKTDKGS